MAEFGITSVGPLSPTDSEWNCDSESCVVADFGTVDVKHLCPTTSGCDCDSGSCS